ncbi:MAG: 50S ribosomal protein L17 [Desulfotomaculales bacterium]
MGYRKLRRNTGHRRAMLRNLVTSLLRSNRIVTTETRAKEIKRLADRMITLAKRGDLASRRLALAYIYDEDVVRRLFNELGEKYGARSGGYTRIVKMGYRRGDGAPLAMVELV